MNKSSDTPQLPLRSLILSLLAALIGGLLLAGCGGDSAGEGSPAPDYAKQLAGSPPPLAALHEQSDELLDGGLDAFEQQMKAVEGFPAVVNIWASWCGPCRAEFPHFQQAGANLGRKVAFLGVDSDDDTDAARTFLGSNSVPYPSFIDRDRKITDELGPPVGLPATAFFDADGNQTFLKQGPYTSLEDLEADIQTYAVEGNEG